MDGQCDWAPALICNAQAVPLEVCKVRTACCSLALLENAPPECSQSYSLSLSLGQKDRMMDKQKPGSPRTAFYS